MRASYLSASTSMSSHTKANPLSHVGRPPTNHMDNATQALVEAQPLELVIGNIVRRILFIIREEHAAKLSEQQQSSEAPTTTTAAASAAAGEEQLGKPVPNLRTAVMEAIGDLQLEVRGRSRERVGCCCTHTHAHETCLELVWFGHLH